jgi:hypothetical protein
VGSFRENVDAVTRVGVRLIIDRTIEQYGDRVSFAGDASSGRKAWEHQIFRMVVDGYVLGRVEKGTETVRLRFPRKKGSADCEELAARFLITAAQIAEGHVFATPAPDVREALVQLATNGCEELLDHVAGDGANRGLVEEAMGRAVHRGREIALTEDMYVDPRMRAIVDRMWREALAENVQGLQHLQRNLAKLGIALPVDLRDSFARDARDELRRLGRELLAH